MSTTTAGWCRRPRSARCRLQPAPGRRGLIVRPMTTEPAPAVHGRALDRRDVASACACAAVALVAYVRTLAPGLTADLDSPLFQFIGRALGVAHNPGYPLYTLLTWPIAQVPVGELAWRINLFSAVMGAAATGLVFLAARRLGSRPVLSAAAALGFAAGAHALVAGGHRRGLHAARGPGRRPAAGRPGLEPLAASGAFLRRRRLPRRRSRPPHDDPRLRAGAAAPGSDRRSAFHRARPHRRHVRGDPGARPAAVRADPRPLARPAGLRRVPRHDAPRAGARRGRTAVPGSALRRSLARAGVRRRRRCCGIGCSSAT